MKIVYRSTAQAIGVGENPLNGSGERESDDIVSTSREKLEKFIRELHELAIHVKILEGREAYNTKEAATKFDESWYDKTYDELMAIVNANTKSDFVYIKFTYQQLGCSEEWFKEMVVLMKNNFADIRREILLEWATGVENSPFKEEDLDMISKLIKQPISVVYLLGKYRFETYLKADMMTYPPIIGVDVSGGYKQDSSTITIIDSLTTKVLGCMNCNYISTLDLARCIEFIVKNWAGNAVVNIERNGVA